MSGVRMGKWQVAANMANMERLPSPVAFLHAFARLGEQLFFVVVQRVAALPMKED